MISPVKKRLLIFIYKFGVRVSSITYLLRSIKNKQSNQSFNSLKFLNGIQFAVLFFLLDYLLNLNVETIHHVRMGIVMD